MEQTERNWGAEEWRAPELSDGDILIFSECGRIINRTDYRSHYYRVVQRFSFYRLLVKHGGGTESFELGLTRHFPAESFATLPADDRYLLLNALHAAYRKGARSGYDEFRVRQDAEIATGTLRRHRPRKKAVQS